MKLSKFYLRVGELVLVLLLTEVSSRAQSPDSLKRLASITYKKKPVVALRLLELATRLALKQGKIDLAANIRVDEATVYYFMNDDQRATTVCRVGIQLHPLADSTRFKLWASLGEMYHQRNRPDSLTYCWQQADALLTKRPALERETRDYVAAFWENRGTAYFDQRDYRMAERCYQKQLLVLANHSTTLPQSNVENHLAYFYLKTGQFSRADSLFRLSLKHYPNSDLDRGWLLLGFVDFRLQRQKPDSVPILVREAMHIAKKFGSDGTELIGYLDQSMGQYWLQKKKIPIAQRFFVRSLVAGEKLGADSRLAWRSLMALSRLASQQFQPAQALSLAQRAVYWSSIRLQIDDIRQNPLPNDFLNGSDLFEALSWKAHLLRSTTTIADHLLLADQTYDRALALSDILQGGYSSEVTKLFVQEKLRPAYQEAMAVAYERYRQLPDSTTLQAFLMRQEQGNASVLRETLLALQNPYPQAPKHLLEALQEAKARLSKAKLAWREPGKVANRTGIEAELINAELAWNRTYQQLQAYAPESKPQRNMVSRLQHRLDSQTVFLQYRLTTDSLLITVVSKHSIQVMMLPLSRQQLNQLAETLRREVYRNPDPFQYAGQTAARALFDKLLAPVWPALRGIRRVVIVRDGPLHYLPMEVLETSHRPGDFLLRHFAITYAYSMRSFIDSHVLPPASIPSILSMAPFAVSDGTLTTIQQAGYSPLINSENEMGTMSGIHSTAGKASKSTFLALLPMYQVLHLATHAEANDTDPSESYIAFFPDASTHRLYAHELGLLNLRHIRLAVLSACRTGSGGLHEGEGLLSLGRAFASAGCPQVITSLWNAHDGTTATLTNLFYEELQRGQPTDVALQQAKLRFLATQPLGGYYSPPHFWAHLVLMGDHQPIHPTGSDWSMGWWMLGTGLGLTLLLVSWYWFNGSVYTNVFGTRPSSDQLG